MKTIRTPDFENLRAVLRREEPERPTLFEFISTPEVMLGEPTTADSTEAWLEQNLRCFFENGYDCASLPPWITKFIEFPRAQQEDGESRSQNVGVISDEESFEKYPWPSPEKSDYSRIREWEQWIPGNGKFIGVLPGGVLENLIDLVGYEDLCYLLTDEPAFVARIAEAVGTRLLSYYERILEYDSVGACMVNDDWGFKTSTMLSPTQMREFIFPWHKKLVDLIHAAGRPAILHSCGNLATIWEDIIEDLGYDGKHSYEDIFLPVEEAYERFGGRIAIMGGMDMDFLCRKSPAEVRERARNLLALTAGKGGYALGSGNSIARYVPRENFLALREVALEDG